MNGSEKDFLASLPSTSTYTSSPYNYESTLLKMIHTCIEFIHMNFFLYIGFFEHNQVVEMIRESLRMLDFQHPHVLSIIGVCVDAGPAPYIVIPFMDNGSMLDYIKKEKKSLVVTEGGPDCEEASVNCDFMDYLTILFCKNRLLISGCSLING